MFWSALAASAGVARAQDSASSLPQPEPASSSSGLPSTSETGPAAPLPIATLRARAYTWQVGTARVLLGETKSVEVVVSANAAEGTPTESEAPELWASTGSLAPPVLREPGVWTTTFTPPADAFPHVAILLARVKRGTELFAGAIPLRLWGKGQTTVRTKPRSKVHVVIGWETFGPIPADADGAARVPIIVPPGTAHAIARSIDDVGNASERDIDLGVPPYNQLALVPLDRVALADGSGSANLLVLAVDRDGSPLARPAFRVTTTVGSTSLDAEPLAPGMFRLVLAPGKTALRSASLDVTLEGAEASHARALIDLVPGRPTRAEIDLSRVALSADDPRAVDVVVRSFDAANNAVSSWTARPEVEAGRLIEGDATAGLERRFSWVLPAKLPQKAAGSATVKVVADDGRVLGERKLALSPGRAAQIALEAQGPVIADGVSFTEVLVRLTDIAGNAIVPRDVAITVPPTIGRIQAGTVDGMVFRARFVPEARDHEGTAVIDAQAAGLRATTTIRVSPRPRARLLVGPALFVGSNYQALAQAGPELSMLVRLPGFDGGVHAGFSLALLQAVAAPEDTSHRAYPLFLEAGWRPLLTPDVLLHLGGAVGFVLTDEVRASPTGDRRAVFPGAAAQLSAGVAGRIGPGFLELDVRGGGGFTVPASSVGPPLGAGVSLGYRLGL